MTFNFIGSFVYLIFLLIGSLALAPVPGTDDANHVSPVCEPHSKNSIGHKPKTVEPLLHLAVRKIARNHTVRVRKCLLGEVETDAMLALVFRVLVGVPADRPS